MGQNRGAVKPSFCTEQTPPSAFCIKMTVCVCVCVADQCMIECIFTGSTFGLAAVLVTRSAGLLQAPSTIRHQSKMSFLSLLPRPHFGPACSFGWNACGVPHVLSSTQLLIFKCKSLDFLSVEVVSTTPCLTLQHSLTFRTGQTAQL